MLLRLLFLFFDLPYAFILGDKNMYIFMTLHESVLIKIVGLPVDGRLPCLALSLCSKRHVPMSKVRVMIPIFSFRFSHL